MISGTYAGMALFQPSLGSFWGISDREQGRPTADIGGNLDGPRKRADPAGRPPDLINVPPRKRPLLHPLLTRPVGNDVAARSRAWHDGCNSRRSTTCQGWGRGRGFESHRPLQITQHYSGVA
jgi:hypothetical protein